eukprot:3390353-Amphidinium_carterae.3
MSSGLPQMLPRLPPRLLFDKQCCTNRPNPYNVPHTKLEEGFLTLGSIGTTNRREHSKLTRRGQRQGGSQELACPRPGRASNLCTTS